MLKLQGIVFPKPGICFVPEMCYRFVNLPWKKESPYRFDAVKQKLHIGKNGIVFFDTYFNGLSIGKWMKYTLVTEIVLALEIKGNFSISLLHSKYINGAVIQKVLATEIVNAEKRQTAYLTFPECEAVGAISFRIDSLGDDGVLFGGGYFADAWEHEPRDIELALNICNYQREAYIYRNMGIIQKYILDNPLSELREHLHIFIADNSRTVDPTRLPANCSNVYPQGDFGGAGGFTRGLIEVLRVKDSLKLTHVVMMDDDILLEPESLERLYAFIRFMKPPYQKAFVGGSLLRMDCQNVQTCHGGEWDMHKLYVFHKMDVNLIELREILLNEIDDGERLNAWWFHCIPLSEISLNNLPYPFFFHMDDTEYDLRNCKQSIHLNGICTWHEPFEYKPGSHLYYYNTRNVMIAHIIHYSDWTRKESIHFLTKEFSPHLFLYRYKEAGLVLRGIEDALRGPDWLVAQNPEELLENVLADGYKKQTIDALPMRLDYGKYLEAFRGIPPESKRQRHMRRMSLNGYLNKAKRDAIIPMFGPMIRSVYRARKVLNYDPVTDRGFITEKSYKELFRLLWRYVKVRMLLNRRFKKVRQEYIDAFPKMTNSGFWYRYLGVEQESEDGVEV